MKTFALCLLTCSLSGPARLWSQADQASPPEIRLELSPGALIHGVPASFSFILTNVSKKDLSIPPPDFNCYTPSQNGTIRFSDAYYPAHGNGYGIGSGAGSCDHGGSVFPAPTLTLGSLTTNWTTLHPGESLLVPTLWAHGSGVMPSGTYTFSGNYFPPLLWGAAERLLSDAGIAIPRQKAATPEQRYVVP